MSERGLTSLPVRTTAEVSFATYKKQQAALARLYPLTVFYTLYATLVLAIAFSTTHAWGAVAFFTAGCVTWTLVEYLFHRYVLHGSFPPGDGIIRRFLHERLDPLHRDHHLRPFDGRAATSAVNRKTFCRCFSLQRQSASSFLFTQCPSCSPE